MRYIILLFILLATASQGFSYTAEDCESDDYSVTANISGAPLAGDFDGDGSDEIGVFSSEGWIVDLNHDGTFDPIEETIGHYSEDQTGATPVYGDFDGNGTLDLGVFKSGTWIIDINNNDIVDAPDLMATYGEINDQAFFGDFDGDGRTTPGVFSAGVMRIDFNNTWVLADDAYFRIGSAGDRPVVGDWTGAGVDMIGVYKAGGWYLDSNSSYSYDGDAIDLYYPAYGGAATIPIVGDWNSDGIDDIGFVEGLLYVLDTTYDQHLTVGTCDDGGLSTGVTGTSTGYCTVDTNSDGDIVPEEVFDCDNGLCPVDRVACTNALGGGEPSCPDGGTIDTDRDMCVVAVTIECDPNYTYNDVFDTCVANPICPEAGTYYNIFTDRCEKLYSETGCPSGYTLDPEDTTRCFSDVECGSGVFNPDQDRCESPPVYDCPPGGYAFLNGQCTMDPICPGDMVYSPENNRCEEPSISGCPDGEVFDSVTGGCLTQVSCISPSEYNPATSRCELPDIASCPDDWGYDTVTGFCPKPLTCLNEGVMDVGRGLCVLPPNEDPCIAGYEYELALDMCISDPWCPNGSTFSQARMRCEMVPNLACEFPYVMDLDNGDCRIAAENTCPDGATYDPISQKCGMAPTQCPDNYIWSDSFGSCVAPFSCPYGSNLNTTIDLCEKEPYPSCESGFLISVDGSTCTAEVTCQDGGTFDGDIDLCTAEAIGATCENATDYFFDSSFGVCVATPDCATQGATYEPTRERCELEASSNCDDPYIYVPPISPFDSGSCVSPSAETCTDGSVYIGDGLCEKGIFPCDTGYDFNSTYDSCVADPICPTTPVCDNLGNCSSFTSIDYDTDTCSGDVVYGCNDNLLQDNVNDVCYQELVCPLGGTFDPATQSCQKLPIGATCPTGYTNVDGVCVQATDCASAFSEYTLSYWDVSWDSSVEQCRVDPNQAKIDSLCYSSYYGQATLDFTEMRCEWDLTDPDSKFCYMGNNEPTDPIPNQYSYDPVEDRCEMLTVTGCGPDTTYNDTLGVCASEPFCATSYNPDGLTPDPADPSVCIGQLRDGYCDAYNCYTYADRCTFTLYANTPTHAALQKGGNEDFTYAPASIATGGYYPYKMVGYEYDAAQWPTVYDTDVIDQLYTTRHTYYLKFDADCNMIEYIKADGQMDIVGDEMTNKLQSCPILVAPGETAVDNCIQYDDGAIGTTLVNTSFTGTRRRCSHSKYEYWYGAHTLPNGVVRTECYSDLLYRQDAACVWDDSYSERGIYNPATQLCELDLKARCLDSESEVYQPYFSVDPVDNSICTRTYQICSGYSWDTDQDVCYKTPSFYCPTPSVRDGSDLSCLYTPTCDQAGATVNADGNCALPPIQICDDGYTWNESLATCVLTAEDYCQDNFNSSWSETAGRCEDPEIALCPIGSTFNGTECVSPPDCPSIGGTYDGEMELCDAGTSSLCGVGWTFVAESESCQQVASCPSADGTLTNTGECTAEVNYTCPAGTTYNELMGICYEDATCPPTGTLNTEYDFCEAPGDAYLCPGSYTFDDTLGLCTSPQDDCLSTAVFDTDTNLCEMSSELQCPPGDFEIVGGICQMTPDCIAPGEFNGSIDICDAGSEGSCLPGWEMHPTATLCENSVECPLDGIFSTVDASCILEPQLACDTCGGDSETTCPDGYTLNQTTFICERTAADLCPAPSLYNPDTDRCEQPLLPCPDGQVWSEEERGCLFTPNCTYGGTFVPERDRCEQVPTMVCVTDDFAIDAGDEECSQSIVCPDGGNYDNTIFNCLVDPIGGVCPDSTYSYNTNTWLCADYPECAEPLANFYAPRDRCEYGLPPKCESGYTFDGSTECLRTAQSLCASPSVYQSGEEYCEMSLLSCVYSGYTYDPALDTCVSDQICPTGTVEVNGQCETPVSYECPVGTSPDGLGGCVGSPDCSPGTYDSVSGYCTVPLTGDVCPDGYVPDGTSVCYKVPECPEDTTFVVENDRCETGPGAAPSCSDPNYTFNPVTLVCENTPFCVEGTFEADVSACVGTVDGGICEPGWTEYTVNTNYCEQPIVCQTGFVFDPADELCHKETPSSVYAAVPDSVPANCTVRVDSESAASIPAGSHMVVGFDTSELPDVFMVDFYVDDYCNIVRVDRLDNQSTILISWENIFVGPESSTTVSNESPVVSYSVQNLTVIDTSTYTCPSGGELNENVCEIYPEPIPDICDSLGATSVLADAICLIAKTPTCAEDGMTWDASAGECTAEPDCDAYAFNPTTDQCVLIATPGSGCPADTTPDPSGVCIADGDCDGGTYNTVTDRCEEPFGMGCDAGFVYNTTYSTCVKDPATGCPAGTVYIAVSNTCYDTVDEVCPIGTINIAGTCTADLFCPSGQTYDETISKCNGGTSGLCPATYTLDFTLDSCRYDITCPYSGVLSFVDDQCHLPAMNLSETCNPGTTEDIVRNLCYQDFYCVGSGTFESISDSCIEDPISYICPGTYTFDTGIMSCTDQPPSCPEDTWFVPETGECRESTIADCPTGTQAASVDGTEVCWSGMDCVQQSPQSYFEPVLDMCNGGIDEVCPDGWSVTLSENGYICTQDISCPGIGIYNNNIDKCQTASDTQCEYTFTLDTGLDLCYIASTCADDGELNVLGKCELPPIPPCPGDYYLSSDQTECLSAPGCEEPSVLNPTLGICEMPPSSDQCPFPYEFDPVRAACISEPDCFGTGTYNPLTNQCESPMENNCTDPSYTYNPATDRCERNPLCIDGTYDPITDQCVKNVVLNCDEGYVYNEARDRCEKTQECVDSATYMPQYDGCLIGTACYDQTIYDPALDQCTMMVSEETITAGVPHYCIENLPTTLGFVDNQFHYYSAIDGADYEVYGYENFQPIWYYKNPYIGESTFSTTHKLGATTVFLRQTSPTEFYLYWYYGSSYSGASVWYDYVYPYLSMGCEPSVYYTATADYYANDVACTGYTRRETYDVVDYTSVNSLLFPAAEVTANCQELTRYDGTVEIDGYSVSSYYYDLPWVVKAPAVAYEGSYGLVACGATPRPFFDRPLFQQKINLGDIVTIRPTLNSIDPYVMLSSSQFCDFAFEVNMQDGTFRLPSDCNGNMQAAGNIEGLKLCNDCEGLDVSDSIYEIGGQYTIYFFSSDIYRADVVVVDNNNGSFTIDYTLYTYNNTKTGSVTTSTVFKDKVISPSFADGGYPETRILFDPVNRALYFGNKYTWYDKSYFLASDEIPEGCITENTDVAGDTPFCEPGQWREGNYCLVPSTCSGGLMDYVNDVCFAPMQKECLSGQYDEILDACIAPAQCPNGSLDRINNVCFQTSGLGCAEGTEEEETGVCSSGADCLNDGTFLEELDECMLTIPFECEDPLVFYPSEGTCAQPAECPDGATMDEARGVCVTTLSPVCEESGASLDSVSNNCFLPPECPDGELDEDLDMCVAEVDPDCGAYTYDSMLEVCFSDNLCTLTPGATYNFTEEQCELRVDFTCGAMNWDTSTNVCYDDAECPQDPEFDTSADPVISGALNQCVSPPSHGCPAGYEYTGLPIGQCEAIINCPPGNPYDANLDQCAGGESPTECPLGSEYMCIPTTESEQLFSSCPTGGYTYDSLDGTCSKPIIKADGMVVLADFYFFYVDLTAPSRITTDLVLGPGLGDGTYLDFSVADNQVSVTGTMWQDGLWTMTGIDNTIEVKDPSGNKVGTITVSVDDNYVYVSGAPISIPGILDMRPNGSQIDFYNPGGGTVGSITFTRDTGYADPITVAETFCSPYSCTSSTADLSPNFGDYIHDGDIDSTTGECIDKVLIFNGYGKQCLKPGTKTSWFNCCSSSAGSSFLFQKSCPEESSEVAAAIEAGRAHYIGDFCVTEIPIINTCVQESKVYCVFSSKLSRIVHEQGRTQLLHFQPSGEWGTPDQPNCEGFSPSDFASLDFGKIDLQEAFPPAPTINATEAQESAAERIQEFYDAH